MCRAVQGNSLSVIGLKERRNDFGRMTDFGAARNEMDRLRRNWHNLIYVDAKAALRSAKTGFSTGKHFSTKRRRGLVVRRVPLIAVQPARKSRPARPAGSLQRRPPALRRPAPYEHGFPRKTVPALSPALRLVFPDTRPHHRAGTEKRKGQREREDWRCLLEEYR